RFSAVRLPLAQRQPWEAVTHCLADLVSDPVHAERVLDEQFAVAVTVWQTLSSALKSRFSCVVPLTRATRASSAAPPARNELIDWPSIVQVKSHPVPPLTEAL